MNPGQKVAQAATASQAKTRDEDRQPFHLWLQENRQRLDDIEDPLERSMAILGDMRHSLADEIREPAIKGVAAAKARRTAPPRQDYTGMCVNCGQDLRVGCECRTEGA